MRLRAIGWLVVFAMLAAAMLPGAVAAFTPGENGQPTSGNQTDLQGRAGDVVFDFQTNMTINCTDDNTTQQFNINLDYEIDGDPLPAGSMLVVYLSPNNGAINGNAGGDEAGYISTVESNEISIDMSGLDGSGTLTFSIPVTDPFQLVSGGVLGVIASDVDGTSWTTKTNSINCGEELPTPTPEVTPTPTPEVTPTPTPEVTPTPTPEVTPTPTPEVTPTPTPVVTPTPTPHPTESAQPTPTPTPETLGSLVIFKVDNKGTDDDFSDDEPLDGASFSIYLDDGDEVFEDDQDELIAGPDEATGGVLEYTDLADGNYWVVEVVTPDGFIGTEPLLIPVDGDGPGCFFDRSGDLGCSDDPEDDGISFVFVDNAPEGQPTPTPTPPGSESPIVTATPGRTLPPTDAIGGLGQPAPDSWRLVLVAIAGILSATLVLTPARRRR
jgi:hypothetical protein